MAEGKPRSTDPPKCKSCGVAHRGTCADHEARGAISSQLGEPPSKRAKMIEGTARKVPVPTINEVRAATSGLERAFPSQTKATEGRAVHEVAEPRIEGVASRPSRGGGNPGSKLETARAALADVTTRGTPRKRAPKGTFDRKAYKAQKARERRAKTAKSPKPS